VSLTQKYCFFSTLAGFDLTTRNPAVKDKTTPPRQSSHSFRKVFLKDDLDGNFFYVLGTILLTLLIKGNSYTYV
jgi:hypothetical protein